MQRELRNIKKIKNPIKVPCITKRNPRDHCDKVQWIINRNSLKSYWGKGVYTSKLHINIMSHSAKLQWFARMDVPLGKPVMYNVTLSEELRYSPFWRANHSSDGKDELKKNGKLPSKWVNQAKENWIDQTFSLSLVFMHVPLIQYKWNISFLA